MQPVRNLLALPAAVRARLSASAQEQTWWCPQCGWIRPLSVAGGYVRRKCACELRAGQVRQLEALRQQQAAARARFTYTWLGENWGEPRVPLQEQTFASFEPERQPAAYVLVTCFVRQPTGVLLLYGSCGTGKTHLLAALANAWTAAGNQALFASMVTFFEAIGQCIQQEQDYHRLLARAIQTPLLLLDDLDKLKPSAFREEVLYHLIDGRTSLGKPLALTANCPPEGLERWVGPAGCSRLMHHLICVPMYGPDRRLKRRDRNGKSAAEPAGHP
jgi:DNA replication protein DnaC